jgi:hypothetical protein
MSSRLSAISLVAAALSLTACPPAVKVSMIPSHSPLTLSFPPVLGSFSVVRRGVRRDYAIHYPGKEFMYPSYRFGLQIQPSANIYAVQGTMPATAFPSQPSGYPLVPHE